MILNCTTANNYLEFFKSRCAVNASSRLTGPGLALCTKSGDASLLSSGIYRY
jgi:hypothetical protein